MSFDYSTYKTGERCVRSSHSPLARMGFQKTTTKWVRMVMVAVHPVGPTASSPTQIGNASPDPRVKPNQPLVHPHEPRTTVEGEQVLRPKVPVNGATLVPVDPR